MLTTWRDGSWSHFTQAWETITTPLWCRASGHALTAKCQITSEEHGIESGVLGGSSILGPSTQRQSCRGVNYKGLFLRPTIRSLLCDWILRAYKQTFPSLQHSDIWQYSSFVNEQTWVQASLRLICTPLNSYTLLV